MKKFMSVLCVLSVMLACFAMSFTGSADEIQYLDIDPAWAWGYNASFDVEWDGSGFTMSSATGQPVESNFVITIPGDDEVDGEPVPGLGTYPYLVVEADPESDALTALIGWSSASSAITPVAVYSQTGADLAFKVFDLSEVVEASLIMQVFFADSTGEQTYTFKDMYLATAIPTQSRNAQDTTGGDTTGGDTTGGDTGNQGADTGAESAVAVAAGAVIAAAALVVLTKKK